MLIIRDMCPEDANAKGYVHWKSWQETYPGIVDEEYLALMRLDTQQEKSKTQLEYTIVAELDRTIVGFAMYGPCRDNDLPGCGEVYAIYILKDAQGYGIGRKLMDAALEKLSDFSTIAIWVLSGNDHAAGFYKHYGFQFDGTKKNIIIGTTNSEVRMILHR